MGGRYFRVRAFAAAVVRLIGGLFSKKDQRVARNDAKRRQKEGAATLHRHKTQDEDRARSAAALAAAEEPGAAARAVRRFEQAMEKNHLHQKSKNENKRGVSG
jgi:hypothetical protein